jgi:hypothetical protein
VSATPVSYLRLVIEQSVVSGAKDNLGCQEINEFNVRAWRVDSNQHC